MISEILRKVVALENIEEAMSERVLVWAQKVEAQKIFEDIVHQGMTVSHKTHKGGKL